MIILWTTLFTPTVLSHFVRVVSSLSTLLNWLHSHHLQFVVAKRSRKLSVKKFMRDIDFMLVVLLSCMYLNFYRLGSTFVPIIYLSGTCSFDYIPVQDSTSLFLFLFYYICTLPLFFLKMGRLWIGTHRQIFMTYSLPTLYDWSGAWGRKFCMQLYLLQLTYCSMNLLQRLFL